MRRVARYDFDTDSRGALVTRKVPPPPKPHDPITGDTADTAPLTGVRVIVARPTEWLFDMRAVSEPYLTTHGWVIDIVDEPDWYAFRGLGIPHELVSTRPVDEVWTE